MQSFCRSLVLLGGLLLCVAETARAETPDSRAVGVLALAIEPDVADQLELTEAVRERLREIVEQRGQLAANLALDQDVSVEEARRRLAPFVAESERQGLRLLTVRQRSALRQLHIARTGLSTLAEPNVARVLSLTPQQQEDVSRILRESLTDGDRGGAARSETERRLAALLTSRQRAAWNQLAGLSGSAAQTDSSNPSPAADVAAEEQPSLVFNFHHQPWSSVIEWFAEQADLSLQIDSPPPGTFNYRDTRAYTPAQALDLMNSVLLTRGFALARRGRILTLINLEDEIPPQYIEFVSLLELDRRGDFELVKVLFPLVRMTAEEAVTELTPLIGPQGKLVPLPKSGQILITENAGRLRTIRSIIESSENPQTGRPDTVVELVLSHVSPEDVLSVARPLLGLEEDSNVSEEIKLAVDPFSSRIFASGSRELIQKLQEIVPMVDRSPTAGDRPLGMLEQPQLSTYPILKADPDQVLQVMQTLMAGLPDVRLAIDPVTNKLVAMARPSEHRTIVETLRQLEGDAEQVEMIQLRRMEPQIVIEAIDKLFGTASDEDEEATVGPRVVGEPTSRKIWVRGTSTQIEQIRDLVEKLEGSDTQLTGRDRRNIRMLPFSGTNARAVIENIEMLWPTLRPNQIRVVTPSAISPSIPQRSPGGSQPEASRQPGQAPTRGNDAEERAAPTEQDDKLPAAQTNKPDTTFTALQEEAADRSAAGEAPPADGKLEESADLRVAQSPTGVGSPDIVISMTPRGLLIASDDLDALDDLETLLRTMMEQHSRSMQEPTVFWLKYAKAEAAATMLQSILSGAQTGGSVITQVTSAPSSSSGLGGILGVGSRGGMMPTGAPSIVADSRLNALIVQASPADLDLIERLLPVIDREAGPEEVQTTGKPRLIPVYNTSADEVATVLKQVYSDRVAGSGGQQRQPSPADFFRGFRGGRGGFGGRTNGGNQREDTSQKMTIGVDARSNSLVVTAPEPLFREVEALVAQLDQEGLQSDDSLSVVTIKRANPELIQKALASIVGGAVKTNTSSTSTNGNGSSTRNGQTPTVSPEAAAARQQMQLFRALRGRGGDSGGSRRGDGGAGAARGDGGGRAGFGGRGGGESSGGRGSFGGGRRGGGGRGGGRN